MISVTPDTTIFRKVPAQSGIYQIDWTILQSGHNGNIELSLSGYGSRFFAFGSDSGNYYASGDSKKYFTANVPNVEQTYSFVFENNKYDVYDEDNNPLMLSMDKPTGYCERLYIQASSGAAGIFELTLKGKSPVFTITGAVTFPIQGPYQTELQVYNSGDAPFSLLSGDFSPTNYISGLADLPKLVQPGSTALCTLSGQLESLNEQTALFLLYTDHSTTPVNVNFLPTTYSGSGFTLTTPTAPTAYFGDTVDMIYRILNTGTTTLKFTPVISFHSRDIEITSGSKFYSNDRIVWTGGEFYIIQTGSGVYFDYLVNIVSGTSDLSSLNSGTYYKYASDDSFNISQTEITSLPNENTMFVVEYNAIVSGLNMARLQFSGIGTDIIISGETY